MAIHSFESMGTVISVRLPEIELFDESRISDFDLAKKEISQLFEELDSIFSLYRTNSEIAKIARGELSLAKSSQRMKAAYSTAIDWRTRTNYAFEPHRRDGVLDLSGTIKAEAIESAAQRLKAWDFTTFLINAGGDILSSGVPENGWGVGVVDPGNRSEIVALIDVNPSWPALATSGISERGEHIWSRGGVERQFKQVSVLAKDILTADVLATSIIASNEINLNFGGSTFEAGVLAISNSGEIYANSIFRTYMRT